MFNKLHIDGSLFANSMTCVKVNDLKTVQYRECKQTKWRHNIQTQNGTNRQIYIKKSSMWREKKTMKPTQREKKNPPTNWFSSA